MKLKERRGGKKRKMKKSEEWSTCLSVTLYIGLGNEQQLGLTTWATPGTDKVWALLVLFPHLSQYLLNHRCSKPDSLHAPFFTFNFYSLQTLITNTTGVSSHLLCISSSKLEMVSWSSRHTKFFWGHCPYGNTEDFD